MKNKQISIITIGDELLIGQVIDTNSAWIGQELNKIGLSVSKRIAVGDNKEDILDALDEVSSDSELVILTGGLGPTADDITKPLLCNYFGGHLVIHEPTLNHITNLFENVLKRPMIERNRKQAEVPNVCTVLFNEKGTAPGMLFEKNDTIFISLPGVPHEMKWIMQEHVLPLLSKRLTRGFIEHRTLLTIGVGESFLAELIQEEEVALPPFIKLAYLPNFGMVRLRLSGFHEDKETLLSSINYHFQLIIKKVSPYLVIDQDLPMEAVVAQLLIKHNLTVSTAESCTGGYIAQLLTSISGASSYYHGSIVSYDNSIKTNLLNVSSDTLTNCGAVSEQTVIEMAKNVRKIMNTDYSVAVSGIMGPEGVNNKKPVGFVWIAVESAKNSYVQSFNFHFDRARNIHLTSLNALNCLRKAIVDNA